MEFIINTYNFLVYQPLFNALVLIYQYVPGRDLGIAVIVLTILVRFALYPMTANGVRMQRKMAEIQPKVKELQEKFKDNKEQQTRAMLELYKQEGVNPLSQLMPLLLQLPLFIALFRLFGNNFTLSQPDFLYSFVADPGIVEPTFLGILNLGESSFILALIAGALQFVQGKQMAAHRLPTKKKKTDKPDFGAIMQTQMIYFLPLFTIFLVSRFPSAFGVYWTVTILFGIAQHWYITKKEDEKRASTKAIEKIKMNKPKLNTT